MRPRGRWYTESGDAKLEDMLKALKGPMVAFFTHFLPYPKKMVNGIEAVLKGALEAAPAHWCVFEVSVYERF